MNIGQPQGVGVIKNFTLTLAIQGHIPYHCVYVISAIVWQGYDMCPILWKKIRLDLAPAPGFPKGSPGRSYLLQVPVNLQGEIDAAEIERYPARATARRFWSSEPDEYGTIARTDGHWLLRYDRKDGEAFFRLGPQALKLGGEVTVEGPDGTACQFRVTSIMHVDAASQRSR